MAPSHHRPGGGFRNPWPSSAPHRTAGVFRWMIERRRQTLPEDPPPSAVRRVAPAFARPRADRDELSVTWGGHSTLLLQIGGLNVLTDPIWSARASPVGFAGPKRWVPAAVELAALPPIDL